jgi:hypothetical protein
LIENRLNIGKKLKAIVETSGGEINASPSIVLDILSSHNKNISELFKEISNDAESNHPIFKDYIEMGEILLRKLVTK